MESQRIKFLELLGRWQMNPRLGVPLLRQLAKSHKDAVASGTEVDKSDFSLLVTQLCGFLIDAGAPPAFPDQCVQEGLHTLYIDILLQNTFWSQQDNRILCELLSGLTHCIRAIQPKTKAANDIILRTPPLLQLFWKNRTRFRLDTIDVSGLESPESGMLREQELLWLILEIYQIYCKTCDAQPPPTTYLPHLGVYFWTTVNLRDLRIAACYHLVTFLSSPKYQEAEGEKFAKDVILNGVGIKEFINRAYAELRREDNPDVLVMRIAWSLARLIDMSFLQAHVSYKDLLSALVAAASRLATKAKARAGDRDGTITAAIEVLNKTLVRSEKVHASDALELLARAIDLLLVEASLTGFNKANYIGITNAVHNLAVSVPETGRNSTANQRRFLADLKDAAPRVWWPGLYRLRLAKYHAGQSASYDEIIHRWTLLGARLKLRERAERQRFEREEKCHCSWKECQFSMGRARMTSPADLKSCGGCKQARYCSTECQKNDWRKGGHKLLCQKFQDGCI
ncbi:unnamed protein product [Peniophora sp. CBMAI 1063]|nr:unnamed protein product [Peniophora sp. CBMAI 1063]